MVESMTDQLGWGLISKLCQYPNKFAIAAWLCWSMVTTELSDPTQVAKLAFTGRIRW